MPFVKTERALAALQDRSGGLRPAERQLLILCNGARRIEDLRPLFGESTEDAIRRLLDAGYLSRPEPPPAPLPQAPPAVAAPAAAEAVGGTRRSVVSAKMYMIGILELVRDGEARERIQGIRGSADEDSLVSQLQESLCYVARKSPGSYAQRVAMRLAEITPQQHLPALQATAAGLFADMATA